MERIRRFSAICAVLLAGVVVAAADSQIPAEPSAADAIVASVSDIKLRLLLEEVLDRNPRLARLAAEAAAAAQRAPQVKALPDPTASLTWFLMSPQTRVGPLQATINISQSLPWFGTLALEEQAAILDAAASRARVEAARLEVVTEARTAYLDLQFLEAESRLAREDRTTLEHYAELALARYASGVGLDQAVIKLQAEITRTDTRLLGIAVRRAEVAARLNALRDRPQTTPVVVADAGARRTVELELEALRLRSLAGRPEMAAATAKAEAAEVRVERSKKAYSPNLMVGLRYGFVGRRDDETGRLVPPEGNGDDDLALTAGVSVPVWRSKLRAGVEEGTARQLAADEAVREATASIDGELGELLHRIPLLEDQVDLYENVLMVQARQSLHVGRVGLCRRHRRRPRPARCRTRPAPGAGRRGARASRSGDRLRQARGSRGGTVGRGERTMKLEKTSENLRGRDMSRPYNGRNNCSETGRGGIHAARVSGERGGAAIKALAWVLVGAVVMLLLVVDPFGVSPVDGWLGLERSASVAHEKGAEHGNGDGAELWTCGMHPEVIQDEPGICPICHMDLVPLKQDSQHTGSHDDSHGLWTCPMHPDILEEESGSCPICGMDLVEVKTDAGQGEREILFYRSPMDPNITSPVPRKDEMGMDYVPVYADEAEAASAQGAVVTIDPAVQQNMNVVTEPGRAAGHQPRDPHRRLPRLRPGADGLGDHQVPGLHREDLRQLHRPAGEEG